MSKKKTEGNVPEQAAPAVAPVSATRTVEELAAENAEQAEIIAELNSKLDKEAGKKTSVVPVVEHDGRSFEVTAPKFSFNGQDIISAEELGENPELVAELVKMGAGVLKEVV